MAVVQLLTFEFTCDRCSATEQVVKWTLPSAPEDWTRSEPNVSDGYVPPDLYKHFCPACSRVRAQNEARK